MKNKKKLLIYAHYYYPDVASTGQILAELSEGMLDAFDITVICVVPSYSGKIKEKYKKNRIYKEAHNGVNLIRVRVPEFDKKNKISRIKNLLAYFMNSIIATIKLDKFDYIYSISQPPILGGTLGVIGKFLKGGKFIYNIQDFNPEQTMAVGYSKNKLILNLAMFLDKWNCKKSDKVIVVGRDMQETLNERFKNKKVPNNVFINNWIDEKEVYPIVSHEEIDNFKCKYELNDKFIIMYSGNIGLYYDLENIIKVIGKFKDRDDIIFAFVGDGSVKEKIEKYSIQNNLNNVKFIPYQPKEKLKYSLNSADVHWVVNAKGIKGVSVPSKLYGVMAVGKPVLGVLDNGSEARLILEESNCGVCSEPSDYKMIENNINYIINNKEKIKSLGMNGREYLENYLSKNKSIDKYKKNILEL
ncbi:glycosyltransferase family 4 protein [Clostridium perfringens]|uniref:glycosyltransferase family 4 protein n=1 Tax=Clostridium perfringens TaxID=1502 RepID=UPI002446A201|nr:glycosyltransferase family 4 protein [Clostridium perfringens]MDH2340220.1 glycosyltransferase family 4 protein [Clostridium perfringens]HDI3014522.1 glycosyltransferase family 4 protein [Clostridium perfringens]